MGLIKTFTKEDAEEEMEAKLASLERIAFLEGQVLALEKIIKLLIKGHDNNQKNQQV